MEIINIWVQMFFEDGSVSQGIRIPAQWLDEGFEHCIEKIILSLLEDVNRDEGWVLLWGAGNMMFRHYPTSFLKKRPSESDSSVL